MNRSSVFFGVAVIAVLTLGAWGWMRLFPSATPQDSTVLTPQAESQEKCDHSTHAPCMNRFILTGPARAPCAA